MDNGIDISWDLKNLDSLIEYIENDLIGFNENMPLIDQAIKTYAERYFEMKLKIMGLSSPLNSDDNIKDILP